MRGLNTGDGRAVFEKFIETVARLLPNRDASRPFRGAPTNWETSPAADFLSLLSDQAPITKQEHANSSATTP